jgi:thiosulfate reductase cytochrome b subunit
MPDPDRTFRKLVNGTLLVLSLLLVLTGLGITYPRIIGPATLDLLSKGLALRLHEILWGPFLVALVVHVLMRRFRRK